MKTIIRAGTRAVHLPSVPLLLFMVVFVSLKFVSIIMNIAITFGFSAISFVQNTTKANVEKGRQLKQAGHVQNVTERMGVITSNVIRQTSVNLPPYNVSMTIDSTRSVVAAICSCIAGIAGHCKHILATVNFINEEDSTTKTSGPCNWKQPSVGRIAKEKYSKGQRWENIFGPREKAKFHVPVELKKAMVTFQRPSMLQTMLQDESATSPNEEAERATVRIISDIPLIPRNNTGEDIKKIVVNQRLSRLLQELYNEDITFASSCCIQFYNRNIPCDALNVCLQTLNDKKQWQMDRKYRITASRAYALYTFKRDDWVGKSRKYFYPKPFSNKYTLHGIAWKPIARMEYSNDKNWRILETGLVVCQTDPWLAVSPDGVVFINNEPTKLLEIKCPFIGQTVTAETIEDHCICLKREKGKLTLKKNHTYYAQVQLNMVVLNLKECDFVVFCSLDKTYKVEYVTYIV